jgi:hypothetical protein
LYQSADLFPLETTIATSLIDLIIYLASWHNRGGD